MKTTITKTEFTDEQLMKLMQGDARNVPCKGCRECCRGDLIELKTHLGDKPEDYDCRLETNPVTGKPGWVLKHKPNGDCIYLGAKGCTIHDRAPIVCREFDCRALFITLRREQRRQWIKNGVIKKSVFDAARKRLHTLTPNEKDEVKARFEKSRELRSRRDPVAMEIKRITGME